MYVVFNLILMWFNENYFEEIKCYYVEKEYCIMFIVMLLI